MKRFFTDEQRNEMDDILGKMWNFMKNLPEGQIKAYSKNHTSKVANLVEEMGTENYLKVVNDSISSGYYNPRHDYFVVDPFGSRFYSYNDPYELFAILRRFY